MSRCEARYLRRTWLRGDYLERCEKPAGHEGQHQRTTDGPWSTSWTRWDDAQSYTSPDPEKGQQP